MSRTRLRRIELAGIKIAVESPSEYPWDWSDTRIGSNADVELCPSFVEPDVHVGVSVCTPRIPDWAPITYAFAGGTFEVGRDGQDWVIAVHHGRERYQRVARFDSHFAMGELQISRSAVADCRHPLEAPLLDLILLHRVIEQQGIVLDGSAVVEAGRALVLVGGESDGEESGIRDGHWTRAHAKRRPLPTADGRLAIRVEEGVVRVYPLPGAREEMPARFAAQLDAIHVLTKSTSVFADSLDGQQTASELLERAYAPIHDPDCTDRLMTTASAISKLIHAMVMGMPEEKRVVPLRWGGREASLGFAQP
jgi:hypothetical protein